MNAKLTFTIAAIALTLASSNALAQGDEDTDATITLMEHLDDKLPEAVINTVGLPEQLMSEEGEEPTTAETNSEEGLTKANQNRQRRLDGITNADGASAQGFEMRESTLENIENMGRSEEFRPEDPPEPPQEPPVPPPGG
jgi:hypothetical protein